MYKVKNFATFRSKDDGQDEMIANFSAEISQEIRYVDGEEADIVFAIKGERADPKEKEEFGEEPKSISYPEIRISADEFASMSWVMKHWGSTAIIFPLPGAKEDLRTAIQESSFAEVQTVYKHTGWTTIGNQRAFLHADGAIMKNGNNKKVRVQVPNELRRVKLPQEWDAKESIRATLALTELSKESEGDFIWPLISSIFIPLFGQADFVMHVSGRTGTYKSELASLIQSHYGCEMNARNLPASWSSTGNSLEALGFFAKNIVMCIDDYIPAGTSYNLKAWEQKADQIVRAVGNQAGRSRLTDTSTLQRTMYPRGMILSTGEDVPEGHSVRARMFIMELAPGDISQSALTKVQKMRHLFSGSVAAVAQYLCANPMDLSSQEEHYRNGTLEIGHSRTPSTIGKLVASAEGFLKICVELGVISQAEARSHQKDAEYEIMSMAEKQKSYLESSDPIDLFVNTIRELFAGKNAYVRTVRGTVPVGADLLGWEKDESGGSMPTWDGGGKMIGWVNIDKDELYIDDLVGMKVIRKTIGNAINLTQQTLLKRLKDAGKISRVDSRGNRNTVRLQVQGRQRQVVVMCLSETLGLEEKITDKERGIDDGLRAKDGDIIDGDEDGE